MPKVSIICVIKTTQDSPIHGYRVKHWNDFIQSLNLVQDNNFELVIAYYQSDDITWTQAKFPVKVVEIDGFYNKSIANTTGAKAADGNIIFFTDIDLLMPIDTCQVLRDKVKLGQCYFPIWWSLLEKDGGRWRDLSFGVFGIHKDDFVKIGTYMDPQMAASWGGDKVSFDNAVANGISTLREKWGELIHQWHPDNYRNYHHNTPGVF